MLSFIYLWLACLTIALVLVETLTLESPKIPPCGPCDTNNFEVENLTVNNSANLNTFTSSGLATIQNSASLRNTFTANNTSSLTGVLNVTGGSLTKNGNTLSTDSDVTSAVDNQTLVTDSQMLVDVNFNNDITTLTQAKKFTTGTGSVNNLVYEFKGSGIMRVLSITYDNVPADVTMNIQVFSDGELVWGTLATPLSLRRLLVFNQSLFQTKYIGSNYYGTGGLLGIGGYIRFNVPFQSSLQIYLDNVTGADFTYSIQPEIQEVPTSILSLSPYKGYIEYFEANGSAGQEYILLNTQGNGNGVFLFGFEASFSFSFITPPELNNRLRVYKSDNGTGSGPINPATGYSDPPDNNVPDVFAGAVNGEVVYLSTNLGSFGLQSLLNGDEPLIQSDYVSKISQTTTTRRYLRYFKEDVVCVPRSSYLSLTLPLDTNCNFNGIVYYYK